MLLVDTSIWIDHLRGFEPRLVAALGRSNVLQHPMILGELALGTLRVRTEFLALLAALPSTRVASHAEVSELIERRRLYGRGLGLVGAHLLASALLTPGVVLWTRDRRLGAAAADVGVAAPDPGAR
ncbi:type II toxin-antitoxin system VapC family toxin [Specibacter cremeus]|uniref:type II toxin-antitoxin system VapC family toxin n=1 Tax=Specibacter cremeus TaxID=1629051 RepID=UPI000F78CD18|nr:PIN domain-containing protein [Specibacter cremeus]